MRACERHPYRYSMCADCDEANPPPVRRSDFQPYQPLGYQLTGLQKTYLDTVRSRITADDLPVVEVDEEFLVTRFRGEVE